MALKRYAVWQVGGRACSVVVLIALVTSLFGELVWQPNGRMAFHMSEGIIGVNIYTKQAMWHPEMFGPTIRWVSSRPSLELKRGVYGVSRSATYGVVYLSFPLLGLLAMSLMLSTWIRRKRRYERVDAGLCVFCGYDLRGSMGDACSECGRDNASTSVASRASRRPSVGKALVVFFTTGVVCALSTYPGAFNPWFAMSGLGGPVSGFLEQMCGPLLWLLDLVGPSFGWGLGRILFDLSSAVIVGAVSASIIRRNGVWRRSSLFHATLAIVWFYGLNVVVLFVMSML